MGCFLPPPTSSFQPATMVQTMEQQLLYPLMAVALAGFGSLTPPFPLRLKGRKTSHCCCSSALHHPLSTHLWIFPSSSALQLPNQLNLLHWSSLHWQCSICFLLSLCLRQISSTRSPLPPPVQPCWPPSCSSHPSVLFLPQGLCTCSSLCPENPSISEIVP